MFVDEHRDQAGQRSRLEIVEQPLPHTFDDQQIAFVEGPRQDLAGVGECPTVDVAPVLQHSEHAIEIASDRLAAIADPGTQLLDLARHSFCLSRCFQTLVELWVVLHRVLSACGIPDDTTRPLGMRRKCRQLQPVDDLSLEVVAIRGVGGR